MLLHSIKRVLEIQNHVYETKQTSIQIQTNHFHVFWLYCHKKCLYWTFEYKRQTQSIYNVQKIKSYNFWGTLDMKSTNFELVRTEVVLELRSGMVGWLILGRS